MIQSVTITDLQKVAQKFQKELRFLPYATLTEVLAKHFITLYPGVQHKDTKHSFERKQDIARPYKVGLTIEEGSLGKMKSVDLEVELAYAAIVDNIQNYKEKELVRPEEMIGSNKTKKHPFQLIQMSQQIRTFAEDVCDAIFAGERDDDGNSALDLFDGIWKKIDDYITAGEISSSKGNYHDCGDLEAPVSNDTNAIDRLVDFVRSADRNLRNNGILLMPFTTVQYCIDALENKNTYKSKDANVDLLLYYLQDKAQLKNKVKLVSSDIMGVGDRIIFTSPKNIDFGMNTSSDHEFCQLRDIYADPNNFQLWIQASYGTRINIVNKKEFMVNAGSVTAQQLSGDYS
jgi:hypothetical protein